MERARMRKGCTPLVIQGGCVQVPEYPEFWVIPPEDAASVALAAKDGLVEYERGRQPNGLFTGPAVQTAPSFTRRRK